MRSLAILALVAAAPFLHAQTTWYVDANGVAPGTGTQADPYTSIQYAFDQPTTAAGHVIVVAPGAYPFLALDNKIVLVRSSAGPASTSLDGLIVTCPTTIRGFTIHGESYLDYGAQIDHCVAIGDGAPSSIGFDVNENGNVRSCTIRGFELGVRFGVWASGGNVLENTVIVDCATGARELNGAVMRYCAGVVTTQGAHWTLSNNLAGDPGLWDAANGDFHLRPLSICVDAGNPASPLDPNGTRADIGAIPFDVAWAPFPIAYCTAKTSSQGCVPSIGFVGSASFSDPAPFLVTASNVNPHRRGFLFYGFAPDAMPFQGATYCVLQPTRRTKGQDSLGGPAPCTGSFSFDFNQRIQLGGDPLLVPGAVVYAQYWFRDPADAFQSGLSNGACFGIAP